MKVLIVGLGSIGQRHAQIIRKLYPEFQIYALRSTKNKSLYYIHDLYTWTDVERVIPDVAFICNPTHLHIKTAISCAKLNMHLFIEKPLDVSTFNLSCLKNIVNNRNLTVYVAYPFRHTFNLQEAQILIGNDHVRKAVLINHTLGYKWMKESYSYSALTGGGALMELSHEIDIARFLFGPVVDVKGSMGQTNKVIEEGETWGHLILTHKNNTVSRIMLDMDSLQEIRNVSVITDKYNLWYNLLEENFDHMYEEQIKYFFNNFGGDMMNDLNEAGELLTQIINFKKGAK